MDVDGIARTDEEGTLALCKVNGHLHIFLGRVGWLLSLTEEDPLPLAHQGAVLLAVLGGGAGHVDVGHVQNPHGGGKPCVNLGADEVQNIHTRASLRKKHIHAVNDGKVDGVKGVEEILQAVPPALPRVEGDEGYRQEAEVFVGAERHRQGGKGEDEHPEPLGGEACPSLAPRNHGERDEDGGQGTEEAVVKMNEIGENPHDRKGGRKEKDGEGTAHRGRGIRAFPKPTAEAEQINERDRE